MSRIYVILLIIAATMVSVTGACFSIAGLVTLFAGAAKSVGVMAASMELSKFIVVGFIYRYWGHIHRPLRAYLIFSIVVLMGITSTGIYGYLTGAFQTASIELHSKTMELESLERENTRIVEQIQELRTFIDTIPNSRISRKLEFQKAYEPRFRELRGQSEDVLQEIDKKQQEILVINNKIGPVAYVAQALGTNIDTTVKYLVLVFVSVFDPLAVSLVFCLNLLIRLREKYHNDEYKIGAHSLTTPVDHRYKKSA